MNHPAIITGDIHKMNGSGKEILKLSFRSAYTAIHGEFHNAIAIAPWHLFSADITIGLL